MTTETLEQENKSSPMMLQWHACKKQAKDALLFFRMGDFYEAFYEDAVILSRELDLVLTKRQGIPMSGVPHHTYEAYLDKLVAKGFRVAIAEQMEDPKQAKGLVKRELVRIVTPGTVINSSLIADKSNNFFASVTRVGSLFGLAVLDLTTSEFRVCEFEQEQDLRNEIHRLRPSELLFSEKFQQKQSLLIEELLQAYRPLLTGVEDWRFDHQLCYNFLTAHFQVHTLDGYGLKGKLAAINAAGALLSHLRDTLCQNITHVAELQTYSTADYLALDPITQRNLELTESRQEGSRKNTLLEILDKTNTSMGGRLLRQWIKQPLLSKQEIIRRQEAIQLLFSQPLLSKRFSELLSEVRDLERLMMKVCTAYASPRDLVALRSSFLPIPEIRSLLMRLPCELFEEMLQHIVPIPEMTNAIENALVDEPPVRLSDGKVFREGYHPELDELRSLSRDSKAWLAAYQNQLKEQTGIKTLKVGFNKMFGYYIEVSRGQAAKMPDTFQRKQTLVNAERYITPELKEYEQKVFTAEERITAIENELFTALRHHVAQFSSQVLRSAQNLARLDALNSLAEVAYHRRYVRPIVDESQVLHIEEGRHPVIETVHAGEAFIPNDTLLDNQQNRMYLITGPNMAGKSTYIRQVALITIMAHIGSFVPAKRAHIGLVDQVFTRIGASDDLSRGQSTFMVEMAETANILNNVTERSLVILDEIGRGTSTYDGISIAWAVAEYLLTAEQKTAKTLFATHYWELTKLEAQLPGAVNYNVAVRECEDQILFLRKIVRGGTDKSYGIHVARLAGMPAWVLMRARDLLTHLEANANRKTAFEPEKARKTPVKSKKFNPNDLHLPLFDNI